MLTRIRTSMEEKDQGFTLIELLVVIIIIGILAAIAIPVFLNQRKKGWDAQAKSDARNLATLEETYFSGSSYYASSGGTVNVTGGVVSITSLPDYKNSGSVQSVNVVAYDGSTPRVAKTDSTATGSYCIDVKSQSGSYFTYDSTTGQLTSGSAASCP